jgi:hypothetical protein
MGVQQFNLGLMGSSRGQLQICNIIQNLWMSKVDIIHLRREADSVETLNVIANLKAVSLSDQGNLLCHALQNGLNPQFLERSEEVSQVRTAINPCFTEDIYELTVFAIHEGLRCHRLDTTRDACKDGSSDCQFCLQARPA